MTDAALDAATRQRIVDRQNGRCFYCERGFGCGRDAPVFDHLTPRRLGGAHDEANRVAACSICDMRKGGREPTSDELGRQAAVRQFEAVFERMWGR